MPSGNCTNCGKSWGVHYGTSCHSSDPDGVFGVWSREAKPKPIKLHYIDRTRIEADWDCPRKRYWMTEHVVKGAKYKGIVPVGEAKELVFGLAMHKALATLATQTLDPDIVAQVLEAELTGLGQESINLGLGLFWAFVRTVWADWLRDYDIVSIEQECFTKLNDTTTLMSRPDMAIRRKSDGSLWYPDFKTTSFKTQNWIESWRYAVQLQTGCEGLSNLLNEPVEGAFVVGLYKGYPKDKMQRSPFTYIYKLDGMPEHGVTDKYSPSWGRGWHLVPAHEYPGGIKAWVMSLDESLLRENIPITGEIPFDWEMLEQFKEQQKLREQAVQLYHQDGRFPMAMVFPQHLKTCRPVIGRECAYLQACFSPSVNRDPVGSGLYKPRTPHHAAELEQGENG